MAHRELSPAADVLAREIGFESVGAAIGADLERALEDAFSEGAVHPSGADPLSTFQAGLAEAIRAIDDHPRAPLFKRFLRDGPFPDSGPIPQGATGAFLKDEETAQVLRFLCGHVVSCFQGFLAEALAAGPLARLLREGKGSGLFPESARLFLGDSVEAGQLATGRRGKAADAHILAVDDAFDRIEVWAVAEVKSYRPKVAASMRQLESHLERASRGLALGERRVLGGDVRIHPSVKKMLISPSTWNLPRSFRLETSAAGHRLISDEGRPASGADQVACGEGGLVRVVMRWSCEAIAAVAFEICHWFLGKVGEAIWADTSPPWLELDPHDAGRNAAKQMLYYALRRVVRPDDRQKAVALYNSFSFGYALGTSFRDSVGRRQMLWPADLEEIAGRGETSTGCSIWDGPRRRYPR